MRTKLYIVSLFLFTGFCKPVKAQNITAYLGYASFGTPLGKTYFETYLTVIGNTVKFAKSQTDKYRGKVNVLVTFMQGDSVKQINTYNILSPEIEDTAKKPDFIDVQRYWLPKGEYSIELKIEDVNTPLRKIVSVKGKVNIGYGRDSICVSDAELLQSYTASAQPGVRTKSGYDMVPYIYNYYPASASQLNFYAEVYNAAKVLGLHQKFVMKYFIESADNHTPLTDFNRVLVQEADTVNPVLGAFDIQALPSGNYNLVLSVIDKNNHILTSRQYNFIRSSPRSELSMKDLSAINIANTFADKMNNRDTLIDRIKSLWPIAGLNERNFIDVTAIPETTITLLKQFFYNFWVGRNSTAPEQAWLKYDEQVQAVNRTFGALKQKGYRTDRGRVYLQYGPPNQRVKSDVNPSSYPYEIWEYYKLPDGEVDKKFVFYEPVPSTNNYTLLHSDAKGEIQNRQWQIILNSRSGQPNNIDQNTIPDPYGEHSLDDFSVPH